MATDTLHHIVRAAELPSFTGLKSTQIDALVAKGEFPAPVKLSARRKGWLQSELIAWQQARIAASRTRDRKSA